MKSKTVFVGMSGGVDSSVTATLLVEQGYEVVGVYMKNWTQDLPGMICPWKEDYQDALKVAVRLGIDLRVFDFQKEYKSKVVDYMIAEYQAGRTPNPDIMCNQEVKFKLFLETALEDGADLIATGHYARLKSLDALSADSAEPNTPQSSGQSAVSESPVLAHRTNQYDLFRSSSHPGSLPQPAILGRKNGLFMATNKEKDQTYFLYRVTEEALSKTLMPIGEFATKAEVRTIAKKFNLPTAEKKDSQGICFVGKVGIRDFLSQYVDAEPGAIIDQNGIEIGQHDGAIFYTIGQRSGLGVGGGLPYYVVDKDMDKNEVYVTNQLHDQKLWHKELQLADLHWINEVPKEGKTYQVRTRYRAPLVEAKVELQGKTVRLVLRDEVRAITPGQSTVIYDDDQVLGGGIVI